MKLNTEAYIDLLGQLRMVAINSNNIEQRNRMRDNMLRMVARVFDATNVCLCRHNFEQKETVVYNHFIGRREASMEQLQLALDKVYPESELGTLVDWLYSQTPEPFVLRTADLDPDSVEYADYAPYNIISVIFAPILSDGKLWGYLEIWDARRERDYTLIQWDRLNQIATAIGDTLLTEIG